MGYTAVVSHFFFCLLTTQLQQLFFFRSHLMDCLFLSKTGMWPGTLFNLLQNSTIYSRCVYILVVYCHLCPWGTDNGVWLQMEFFMMYKYFTVSPTWRHWRMCCCHHCRIMRTFQGAMWLSNVMPLCRPLQHREASSLSVCWAMRGHSECVKIASSTTFISLRRMRIFWWEPFYFCNVSYYYIVLVLPLRCVRKRKAG